ncbi:uncharacterized protein LOC131332417 [Rhododendron vialii]|uniref:uncharacterized protein LOC131332417 n=1 Tax=Rhododendron vialii TaxID=182163 RepID=UPI00265F0F72|nr:uncharacterized protein LOC131332417 [Rhododendron vialii]
MSGSGGFAVSRTHGGDRFYNPPPVRRQQLLLQQEKLQRQQEKLQRQQLLRPLKSDAAAEAENRTDSDDSTTTLSKPTPSVCSSSSSPPRPPAADVTNLDRLVESVTPFIPARLSPEVNGKGWRTRESDVQPYYCLGDLWESFREWSVYGAGVPLLLNGKDSIMQYYVPFLSGIQLYVDPRARIRRPGEESDVESSRETSSAGSSDCEAERRAKSVVDGSCSHQKLVNLNSQRMNGLSLRDKSVMSSSSDEAEMSNSPGTLLFEFLEHEQPYNRRPLTDKVSLLASQFPDLRSCDLLSSSWISVAWYPIYRIPMGPTLRDLDASFLTFHSLSTCSTSNGRWRFHGASGRKVHGAGIDASPKISLPVFGLASYKLKGSILTPTGPDECEKENSLLQYADDWLRSLQVTLPDYQFFLAHYSQWR